MKSILISFVSGIIFSVGLVISGLTNPEKVIGFLDVFGNWDYSLVFVMGGAIAFNLISFKFITKRKPVCSDEHQLPTNKLVDKKLIIGSAIFGLGWGTLGFCPGPGIVNLVTFNSTALLFVGSMIAGMYLYKITLLR